MSKIQIPNDVWILILDYLKGECSVCGSKCKTCVENKCIKRWEDYEEKRLSEKSICTECKSGLSQFEPVPDEFVTGMLTRSCNICEKIFVDGFHCIYFENKYEYYYDDQDSEVDFNECDFDICKKCYEDQNNSLI